MLAPPISDAFHAAFAGLEEQTQLGGSQSRFHECFGCGQNHPSGLRVRAFKTDDGIASPIIVPRLYEGPPGATHGGIVAAYLDEVLAATVFRATGRPAVTGELTVRYVKPVPSETPIIGRGVLVADHGRYVDVEGRLETLSDNRVLATARARFFPLPDAAPSAPV